MRNRLGLAAPHLSGLLMGMFALYNGAVDRPTQSSGSGAAARPCLTRQGNRSASDCDHNPEYWLEWHLQFPRKKPKHPMVELRQPLKLVAASIRGRSWSPVGPT